MSKSTFAQTIISKLKAAIGVDGSSYSSASATSAMTAIANGITEYLIANTIVTITYSGTIPGSPPITDPTIADNFKIIGTCAPTGPSNNFDTWIKQIESNIIAGFSLAEKGNDGVVFAQKPFLNPGITIMQSQLKAKHDVSDTDPQQKIWELVCGGIMDWINSSAINTASGAATHTPPGSSGIAQIAKITLS